jgi:hypothetical protein
MTLTQNKAYSFRTYFDGTTPKIVIENADLVIEETPSASETVAGKIKISTTAQVTAGGDDTSAVTPFKLFSLFSSASLSASSGYFQIPYMIDGIRKNVIIQFGADVSANTVQNITFPIPFPTACCAVVPAMQHNAAAYSSITAPSTTGFTIYKSFGVGARWIAIGY